MKKCSDVKADQDKTNRKNYFLYFLLVCEFIFIVFLWYSNHIGAKFPPSSADHRFFGDMFGPLAALFSGFAFAGVIVTIIMQMEELRLAREVSDKAATAQQGSEKALKDQIEKMQLSSDIAAISSYIQNQYKNSDEEVIAVKILGDMTESIFFDRKYFPHTMPNLEIKTENISYYNNYKEPTKCYHLGLIIHNSGASCKYILHYDIEVMSWVNKRVSKVENWKKAYSFHEIDDDKVKTDLSRDAYYEFVFEYLEIGKIYEIAFQMKPKFSLSTWTQKLKFIIEENNIPKVDITAPEYDLFQN